MKNNNIESLLNIGLIYFIVKKYKNVVLVLPNNKSIEQVSEQVDFLRKYLIKKEINLVKIYENNFYDEQFFDLEKFQEENSYNDIMFSKKSLILIAAEAIFRKTSNNLSQTKVFKVGDIINLDELKKDLISMAYKYETPVEEKASFEIKGGIIDIFPPAYEKPIRIELFGDEIESIRFFDPNYQTSIEEIKEFKISNGINFEFNETNVSRFYDFIEKDFINDGISFDDKEILKEFVEKKQINHKLLKYAPFFYPNKNYISILKENNKSIFVYDYFSVNEKIEELKENENFNFYYKEEELNNLIKISPILEDENKISLDFDIAENYRIALQEEKTYSRFTGFIEQKLLENKKINIFYTKKEKKNIIKKILNKKNIVHDNIIYKKGFLKEGFRLENDIFISDYLILGEYSPKHLKQSSKNIISSFSDLNIGDYVVHSSYGIGKYCGLVSRNIKGSISDFLEIHYANEDKLFLPVYNMSILYKHSSNENKVKLDSFKSKSWQNKKSRIKKSIKKIASELIKIYAKRVESKAIAFSKNNDELYEAFCSDFPYTLTNDQEEAIKDVIIDMEKLRPMDRLVCGDVGFGKTEVAMRAAFKAVLDNYQVVLLAPTTVLAFQHYLSFKERFKNFPISIEYISSFKSLKEKKKIFEEVNQHKIDILIGTQSILNKNIDFKKLGLLIVDEEQKFGVKDKEKLKELKSSLDTITLTATPIPRTLNFSLSGIRDLSIIKTPPKDRKAVKTVIIRKTDKKVKKAIEYELQREGQIFYIHNRISSIYEEANYILSLFPNIKMAIAHSEIPKKRLEKIMLDFYNKKFDLLLSTNIIESGIDIPNANTMIINRADIFGLSSLYQLRGRVGRAKNQGYALLIIPAREKIAPIAQRRLSIISRYTDLGSGFQIAMQDLEIRGAGSLLGYAQKGHFNDIGYDAYMSFLRDAILELKGEKNNIDFSVELNTSFTSLIPSSYIVDEFTRLSFYKRISNCYSIKEIEDIQIELKDRFGNLPKEVFNFIYLVKIKIKSIEYKISKINIDKNLLYMKLADPNMIDLMKLMPYLNKNKNLNISPSNEIILKENLIELKFALEIFEELLKNIF